SSSARRRSEGDTVMLSALAALRLMTSPIFPETPCAIGRMSCIRFLHRSLDFNSFASPRGPQYRCLLCYLSPSVDVPEEAALLNRAPDSRKINVEGTDLHDRH